MLIKLVEVKTGVRGGVASLNEIYVNTNHIISIAEDVRANQSLVQEVKRLGLVGATRFSKIVLSEGSHVRTLTVIGDPSDVHDKFRNKQILRG